MSGALRSLATAVRIAAVSSNLVTNVPTALVSFVLRPAFDILLLVGFVGLAGGSVVLTACAGIFVAVVTTICGGVATSVAGDRLRGVLSAYLSFERGLGVFWVSRMVVPAVAAGVVATLSLAGLRLLGVLPGDLFLTSLALVGLAMLVGCLLSVLVGALAALGRDPYLVSDLLGHALPLLTGVIVPIGLFPAALGAIARWIPGSGVVLILRGAADWSLLWPDVLVGGALAVVGVVALRFAMRAMRAGTRSEAF